VTHIISPNLGLRASAIWEIRGQLWGGVLAGSLFFCAVHPQTVRACLADSSRLADSLRPLVDHSVDRLDRSGVFRLEATFVLRTVCSLSSGQSAPSLVNNPIYTLILAKFDQFLLTVKIRQPSHEFTFGVGITFVSYSLVLTPVV
jgi:hypothetical protein